ncbi:MAG: nucleotide exchange factor GrpE [Alphaproteobacteria bacterium]
MSKKFKNKHNDNMDNKQTEHTCECACNENKECHCHNCECEHHKVNADCGEGVKCAPEGCEAENDKIENLKAEISSWQERYLRTMADCENAKRRAEIDAKNMVDYKISKFAKDMLPLADNLALALTSMEGKVDENIFNGLKSIKDSFISALEKNGICKIPTVGEPLNPAQHCVVMQVDDPNVAEGTIARELQAGYKLGDKVIREAMVATSNSKKN